MQKFHVLSFALSAGIFWGVGVFCLAILGMYGMADKIVTLLADGYFGLALTWPGAFIGLIWGFLDAFIGGAVFAILYNFFAAKFK